MKSYAKILLSASAAENGRIARISAEAYTAAVEGAGSGIYRHLTGFVWGPTRDEVFQLSDLAGVSGPVADLWITGDRQGFPTEVRYAKVQLTSGDASENILYVEVEAPSECAVVNGALDAPPSVGESIECYFRGGSTYVFVRSRDFEFPITSIRAYMVNPAPEGFWTNFRKCREVEAV